MQRVASLHAARLIRTCRTASRLTLQDLAWRSGLPSSVISEYETGEKFPPFDVLYRIISATGHRACATSGSLALDPGSEASKDPEASAFGESAEEDEGSDQETARLRARVEGHLTSLGFQVSNGCLLAPVAQDKDQLRALHADTVQVQRIRSQGALARHEDGFVARLARGAEVAPEQIRPALVPITDRRGFDALLWRWCSLHWSIPVSSGYGRRMRFLVIDRGHDDKVIGLIGLADPVYALACRDSAIGWNRDWRRERLFSVMDAFVLGAVPPYNALCGGKLVALLATSSEVRDAFAARYRDHITLIAQRKADARLALVTTSSALGRSSVYNRLTRPDGRLGFRPVGYTLGSGDFHFAGSIYRELAEYAARNTPEGVTQRHERWTGETFRNRREVIQRSLDGLGYDSRKLRIHGVRRQVFLAPLAENALEWLRGESQSLDWNTLDSRSLGTWWLERWALGRAARIPDWQHFDPETWRLYG
jgi:transcriptional regulator with XRE-family HTH domain